MQACNPPRKKNGTRDANRYECISRTTCDRLIRLAESTTILECESEIQGIPVIWSMMIRVFAKARLATPVEFSREEAYGLSLQSAGGPTSNHDFFISFLR